MAGLASGGPVDLPYLSWLVYTYTPKGFALEHPVGCTVNVIGCPFPISTRPVSSLYPPLSSFAFLSLSHSLNLS